MIARARRRKSALGGPCSLPDGSLPDGSPPQGSLRRTPPSPRHATHGLGLPLARLGRLRPDFLNVLEHPEVRAAEEQRRAKDVSFWMRPQSDAKCPSYSHVAVAIERFDAGKELVVVSYVDQHLE